MGGRGFLSKGRLEDRGPRGAAGARGLGPGVAGALEGAGWTYGTDRRAYIRTDVKTDGYNFSSLFLKTLSQKVQLQTAVDSIEPPQYGSTPN